MVVNMNITKINRRSLGAYLLVILLVITLIPGCNDHDGNWHTVKRVIDGDTFIISPDERVRIIGVDTPETVKPNTEPEPYGQEASAFAKEMLEGKKVRLEFDVQEQDRFGRLLAYVYLEDGTFFNALLLKKGYAQVMTVPPNVRYAEDFLKYQRQARENKKGLWGLDKSERN
ncbi:thermonuclease family protein [Peptococcaceae bacterium]|nr:thermonuclease family protein [Peptococcaceae bacterium]